LNKSSNSRLRRLAMKNVIKMNSSKKGANVNKIKFYSTLSFAVFLSLMLTVLFTVPVLAAGTIVTSPLSGPVGTAVIISGTGFTAGSTYTINYDGAPIPAATGTIAAGGALGTTSFLVPASTAGAHNIQVTTSAGAGDTSNVRQFTVVPSVTLSSTTVAPGTLIVVYGAGFGANRTVTIYIDSTAYTTTSTDANGSFAINLQIPSGAGGLHTITATDTLLNSAAANYTITANIAVSPSSVKVGSQVTVTGTTFAASTTVRIYVGGTLVTTAATNSAGSFTATFVAPQGAFGSQTVTATDLQGNSDTATYNIIPSISSNTSSISSGSQVVITGNGFAASSVVKFYLDNSLLDTGTISTNGLGTFSTTIVVPTISAGSHILQVVDSSSNSATLSFSLTQGITVTPQSGATGSNIQVSGTGFVANHPISITLDGATVTTIPASPVTDAGGAFSAVFKIPAIAGGLHTITVTDGTFSFSANIMVTSNASISVIHGNVGTNVTVTGTSFAANAAITVSFDNASVATATTDAKGAFSTAFAVPPSTSGNHTIVVTDRVNTISFTFSVMPKLVVNPSSGDVGTQVTLTGTGFAAQRPITVKYDATAIQTSAQTDASGDFTVVFNAPVSKGGDHSIIVSDGINTVTGSFAMDSTPPPVPTPISPINVNAGSTPEFIWQAVTDPSGVTYTLQISKDITFNTVAIEKKGLTVPDYQLTEAEKLQSASKSEPYYWRVQAIDGASNASTFSAPQTFWVGFILPTWGLYLIFGVCVLIAFFLGFFLRGVRHL
jgi:hypothetical protein